MPIYQWRKGLATWVKDDTLYISVVFSWDLKTAESIAAKWPGPHIIGGPALPSISPDPGCRPIIYHNACASYSTYGCPYACEFCKVKIIQPEYGEIADYIPAPLLIDNNYTAASFAHKSRVVEKQKHFPFTDFNQGLKAELFDKRTAVLLGSLNCKIRFAFDHPNMDSIIDRAVKLCREHTTNNIGVYVLIGFEDTPDDALYRLEFLRRLNVQPFPMRYQPINTEKKNSYLSPKWSERQLRDVMRYYSNLNRLGHIPFSEYNYRVGH